MIEVLSAIRRFVVLLTIFAILGATTVSAVPLISDGPCAHQASGMQPVRADTLDHGAPCKTLTPECVKLAGCIGLPALCERPASASGPAFDTRVVYALLTSAEVGLSQEPDLPPPIVT